MKQKEFIKEFFKKDNSVGAVAPSSKFLTKLMMKPIDFSSCKRIVELGPGTGVFTEELMRNLAPDGQLISVEINEKFANHLRIRFQDKRFSISQRSAAELPEILQEHGMHEADCIVSALPFAVFPKELKDSIFDGVKQILTPEGAYVQFQYSLNLRKTLSGMFDEIKINFTALNIPPAFVYSCRGIKKK